jgi:hypothetical protein
MAADSNVIIRLYQEFDNLHPWDTGSSGTRQTWTNNSVEYGSNQWKEVDKLPFAKELSVDNSVSDVQKLYNWYGVIQLRRYAGERKLILGCGNNPIFIGSTPLRKQYDSVTEFWSNYAESHKHVGCYTINPDIGMNPSIVGCFGIEDFTFLPKGAFTEIEFEGFLLNAYILDGRFCSSNVRTVRDLVHLLAPDGIASVKREDTTVHKFRKARNRLIGIDEHSVVCDDSPLDAIEFFRIMEK